MNPKFLFIFLLILLVAASCTPAVVSVTPTAAGTSTALPPPSLKITEAPSVQKSAETFLGYWQAEDYENMYAALARVSRDAITYDGFVAHYKETAASLTLQELNFQTLSTLTNPTSAQVAYRVLFDTTMFTQLQRDMVMNLVLENGTWHVLWEDGLILPELSGGNRLVVDIKSPSRGSIKDLYGDYLASQADVVAIGIVPSQVAEGQAGFLISQGASLAGVSQKYISDLYEQQFGEWYIPIGEAPLQSVREIQDRYPSLINNPGLQFRDYSSRFYYGGGIAPHAVGYVLSIPAEQLDEYLRLGYPANGKIGASGLEKWGEPYLAGQRGLSLYVVDSRGQVVTRLAQVESKPANNIVTTLDSYLQSGVQRSIEGFKGAVVVIERNTGRVLAMASSPSFDPNVLDPENYNSFYSQGSIFNSADLPLLNRASQSSYPIGSVFKIVTMAAALESGLFSKDTVYYCGHEFTDVEGLILYDWTYAKEFDPSGDLTLQEGLMRSCNPWFWHIGLEIYRSENSNFLAEMSRSFGLGSPLGIGQVPEDGGNIQDAASEGDAVQLAIGQGTMLATPLQVANMVAAIGNGGTLYRPSLVERIESVDGTPETSFEPEVIRQLPISAENLEVIQKGMNMVVSDTRGTAYRVFGGMNYWIHAKSGSATTSIEDPHSWFAGYTNEEREDLPDIAVSVIAENAGEGSEIAAWIFRRILEIYFEGKPRTLYPWESSFYITQTPTPLPTDNFVAPTPRPTETPAP